MEIMINIDFLITGCNTHCQHCYVNGGPNRSMPIEDVLLCMERLDTLGSYLLDEISFTLDQEPMNHPQIEQILHATTHMKHIQYYHHGMTTGIGMMQRKEKEQICKAYFDCGYDTFGITIHGNAIHHDTIVQRKGAYDITISAAEYLRKIGAKMEVSLMLNRYFKEDAENISIMLEQIKPDYIGFAIPIFTPHSNMFQFEQHRASMETIYSLQGYLQKWKQDEEKIIENASKNTISAVIEQLKTGVCLQDLFLAEQEERYLTLHQDCKLYVGNSGAETCLLGDLRTMDLKETAKVINGLSGNRDYGAFYDLDKLPSTEMLITALEKLPKDMVYGDFESVIYRGFVELGIPVKILHTKLL